jgi:hypothetical protein
MLTGAAENADPVCHLSPHHTLMPQVAGNAAVGSAEFVYRRY